jgi:TRAP-type uncharacterized transport system fused permease subunit
VDAVWPSAILVVLTAILGVLMLGTALEGYLMAQVPMVLRLALLVCAILLIQPNIVTDLVGLVIATVTVLWQWRQRGKGRGESCMPA